MGRRRDSVMTSLWLDKADHAEIQRRAQALRVSKAEVIRRMVRWALAAAGTAPTSAESAGLSRKAA